MPDGIVAEFASADALAAAFERMRAEGRQDLHAWSPYPVRELVRAMPRSRVPWIMLVAGALGGLLGYLVQWWTNAWRYPLDVGGRPLHSAPAFIPIAFESCILAASLAGFFGLLSACRLPRLHHPVFELDGFERVTVDRFWLWVHDDQRDGDGALAASLGRLGALRCTRVGWHP
ncbi:MAG: DUF3341 domain-containing protein [Polyangiaceae bacterium]|nr:DUF3341 domain-containing protein [Polyangiaceae bacterium]